jgi:AraC-like DNA-binding protein
MTGAPLLNAYPLVRTDSIEELRAAFDRIIAKPVLQPIGRDRALRAFQNHCQLHHIGASYGSYGTGMHFKFPEPRVFLQIFPIDGKAEVRVNGMDVAIDKNSSAIVTAGTESFDIVSDAAYERLGMLIESEPMTAKLDAMLGQSVQQPLDVWPEQDYRSPLAHCLRQHFLFLVGQMNIGVSMPPLVITEFEQTLMVMFLYANRHNYSALLERNPPGVASAQVRRAEAFIEANWDKPLRLETLAAVSGVGVRSLARDFRRSRGCTPTEFLRQVRLRRARERLRRPDANTTLAGVAGACGYGSLARFGHDYFRTFGERPEDTLLGGTSGVRH